MTAACPSCGAPLPASGLDIRDVGVVLARTNDEQQGLLGRGRLRVGPFEFSGLCVRRTSSGEIVATYPARKDGRGALHREITLLDPDLDRRIRAAVIAGYVEARGRAGRSRP